MSTPQFKGDTGVARVEALTHEGHGVARVDGKAVFIQGALPGEEVRFRYHNKRKSYDTGGLLEVLRASPHRIAAPRCPHFGVCGGCSLQHLDADAQIDAKQRLLLDDLARIGKVEPERVLPPLQGSAWHYRRKARLGVRVVPKKGGVLVGFRERRRSYITKLATCETLDARLSVLLPALARLIGELSCPDRVPQIEIAAGDDAVALVFRYLVPLTAEDESRLSAFARARDVQAWVQPGPPESVRSVWPVPAPPLTYRLAPFDLTLHFGPTDFVQVNAEMNARLIAQALDLLAPGPRDRVLDLFCGLGNFSLPLARRAGQVLGVEADARLVQAARANAARNGVTNAEFMQADLYGVEAARIWAHGAADLALLDPPRTGAMEVITAIPDAGPRRLVYVSCNPATLARDSAVLAHVKGYRLRAAGVADMFPHTTHVESVALFEKPA